MDETPKQTAPDLQAIAAPAPGKKIGRPTVMTPETCDKIIERLIMGDTLSAICRDLDMPGRSTVIYYKNRAENSAFAARYAQARLDQMDTWGDQSIDIADDGTTDYITKIGRNGVEYEAVDQEHIQRSRLRVDTRMRLMAVIAPHTYGERVTHDHSGEVEVVVKLSDRERMRRMALFLLEDQAAGVTIDGELVSPEGAELSQSTPPDVPKVHDNPK